MIRTKVVTSWDEVPVIFDMPMAARLFGRSVDSLKLKAQAREIPAFKIGAEWRFDKDAIQAFIKSGGNL